MFLRGVIESCGDHTQKRTTFVMLTVWQYIFLRYNYDKFDFYDTLCNTREV